MQWERRLTQGAQVIAGRVTAGPEEHILISKIWTWEHSTQEVDMC